MAYIRHDSHGETVIKSGQILGEASPLETDSDGYAEVEDEETATRLAAVHRHVTAASPRPDTSDAADEDDADGADDEFDATAFVDRTPVSEVADEIASGEFDAHLDAIEAAEEDSRGRMTVYDAIANRRE